MKNKKHKYKKMSEEQLKSGKRNILKQINNYNNNEPGVFVEINMFFIFSFFLILSWIGLIKLLQYQYVFTIYRYINYTFSTYFPIQITSIFLLLMTLFIVLIISLSCIFFIIKIARKILKKENTIIFNKKPIIISIPIILNSLLFLLGIIINRNNEIIYYYFGLFIDLISLFILLKINFDKKLKNNIFMINYQIEVIKLIFEDVLFDVLLALDLYYSYYVIFQIIYHLSNYNIELLNFSGIVMNLFMGLTSFYTNFKLQSISFNILYIIIYLGIFIFQLTIRREEREEFQIGYGEAILSWIFCIIYFVDFIYLTCLRTDND